MVKYNEKARDFFNEHLEYSDITIERIQLLLEILPKHIEKSKNCIKSMRISKSRKMDIKFINGGLSEYYIHVDSHYFKRREAISFNSNGFIGFAGWASSENTEPFIDAFMEWVILIKMRKLKKEVLTKLGFVQNNSKPNIYYSEGGELEYNTTTNELYLVNEGVGEPQFLCKTHDADILSFLFEKYEGYHKN